MTRGLKQLTARQIKAIEKLEADGMGYRQILNHISEQYGVGATTLRRVLQEIRAKKGGLSDADIAERRIRQSQRQQSVRRDTFWSMIGDTFTAAVQAIPAPKEPPPSIKHKSAREPEEVGLMISDCQIGQLVDVGETGGLGNYNYAEFKARATFMLKSFSKIIDIQTATTPAPALNVFFLGDIVDGAAIHPGHQRQLDLHAAKQVIAAVDMFAHAVAQLAAMRQWNINVYGVVGNHGRIGKKGEESPMNNLDFLAYHFLAERLREHENVKCAFAESWFQIVKRMGKNFLLVHGDDAKSWGGIPMYGILRSESRYHMMLKQFGVYPDYFLLGHHHQEFTLGGRVIANSSWVGGSEFSAKTMQMANAPSQSVFGIHPDYGLTWRRDILLINPRHTKGRVRVYE